MITPPHEALLLTRGDRLTGFFQNIAAARIPLSPGDTRRSHCVCPVVYKMVACRTLDCGFASHRPLDCRDPLFCQLACAAARITVSASAHRESPPRRRSDFSLSDTAAT